MKRTLLALVLLLAVPALASAQTVVLLGPNSKINVTVNAPDLPTAQGIAFGLSVDAAASKPMTATCVLNATTPVTETCSALVGTQLPSGSHTIIISGTTASGVVATPSPSFAYNAIILLITNVTVQ